MFKCLGRARIALGVMVGCLFNALLGSGLSLYALDAGAQGTSAQDPLAKNPLAHGSPVHMLGSAADDDDEGPLEQHMILTHPMPSARFADKKLLMHVRRFVREGAPPVILSHAVVLTNVAMRRLGRLLWDGGFDVWMPNMRGHGNGEEMTRVVPYERGDYHFDPIVTQDWPLLLTHVYKTTQQKVSIIGYSMGGMTWEQTLSGVYAEDGHIRQSAAVVRKRSDMVKSFISLATPADLNNVSAYIKVCLYPMQPVLAKAHSWIPITTARSNQTEGGFREWVRRKAITWITPILPQVMSSGVITSSNMEKNYEELRHMACEEISSPHTDYTSDLVTWFLEAYASRDGAVNYEQNKNVHVPMLLIVASNDELAPPDYTIERAYEHPPAAEVRVLHVDGFSHVDISFAKALPVIGPAMLTFLKDPKSFSAPGEVVRVSGAAAGKSRR